MEPNINHISFVPTDNCDQVCIEVRDWIRANAFMGLQDGHQVHGLDVYEGGNLYLTLGGYVRNPCDPTRQASVEASFGVHTRFADGEGEGLVPDTIIEDPEGTRWHVSALESQVGWLSWGSTPARLARMRVDMIEAAMQLGEMFDARFKDTRLWVKASTKAQRDEWWAKVQQDSTRIKVHAAIKEAIHGTCRGMRVRTQMFVPIPEGWVEGTYQVALENKEYDATVNAYKQLVFTRTK